MHLKRFNNLVKNLKLAEALNKHKKAKKIRNIVTKQLKPQFFMGRLPSFKLDVDWSSVDNNKIIYIPSSGYENEFPVDVYTKNKIQKICFQSESLCMDVWDNIWHEEPSEFIEYLLDDFDTLKEQAKYLKSCGVDLKLARENGYLY